MSRVREEERTAEMERRVQSILREAAVIREGHFAIGDRHSRTCVDKDAVYANPASLKEIADLMVSPWIEEPPDLIVGSGKHAKTLVEAVVRAFDLADVSVRAIVMLGNAGHVFPVFREQPHEGSRALVMKDILTSGETIRALADRLRTIKVVPHAVQAIWNHGGLTAADLGGVPVWSLVTPSSEMYPAAGPCKLCEAAVPLVTLSAA